MKTRPSIAAELATPGAGVRPALIWRLAIPVLGQNVLGMFVGWSDAILAGQILVQDKFLAAGAVGGYLVWLMESFSAVISTGVEAIVARAIGAGDVVTANRMTQRALVLAAVLGIAVGVGFYQSADQLGRWMGLDADAAPLAARYLRIISLSCPAMMLLLVGVTCLRAAGHTLPGMWILSLVNLCNLVTSWLLTVGVGPLEGWGWPGIATGTAISFYVGAAVTLWLLGRGHAELKLSRRGWLLDFRSVVRILRIGIPGAANSMAVVLFQLWFLSIITTLGTAAVAAHGVAIRCESLSFLAGEAFAIATATLVGQSLGARRPDLARRYGWSALGISTCALSGLGVIFFTAAPLLFRIFVRSEETSVLEQGVPVLRLVAFGMPALAAGIVLSGGLRGAGDTRWPLAYNTAGLLLVRIPLAYALTDGWVTWGLFGAWTAMLIDLYARAGLAILRFLAAGWTRTRV